MDTGDCQPLYHSIRDYYEGMNMKIDQQIPMLLVERHALNEAIEGEKNVMIMTILSPNCVTFLDSSMPFANICCVSRVSIICPKLEAYACLKSRQLAVYGL